jgi:hypothetical protein
MITDMTAPANHVIRRNGPEPTLRSRAEFDAALALITTYDP